MRLWLELKHGLARLLRRTRDERELQDEVQHYLEQSIAERVRNGASEEDARRAVRHANGNALYMREEVRSFGWEQRVETLTSDIRYAWRRLRQTPAFTIVAVLSLALGIGANTAIFSLINATLLKPLPVERPEELAYVRSSSSSFSYPDLDELRRLNTAFSGLAAFGGITGSLRVGDETSLVVGAIVTGNFFSVLGVNAAAGRVINTDDDRTPGAHPVAVISHRLWQSRFVGSAQAVGRDVRFNGQSFTVIGVLPPGFHGAVQGQVRDIYVPMMMQAVARPPRGQYSGDMDANLLNRRANRWLTAIGRLRAGNTPEQALAQLTVISQQQERLQPANGQRISTAAVIMVKDGLGDRTQLVTVSRLLLFVVGAVLLIACVNVANLTIAQSGARRKEVAVRLALGATRHRLIRQLLTESIMLSALGATTGWVLSWSAIRAMRAAPTPEGALPITLDFSMDARVLLYTAVLAVATGILFGLMPALTSSRPQLVPALKDQGTGKSDSRAGLGGRSTLVVAQLALSVVLLVTAGLFLRSFARTQSLQAGYDTERVAFSPLRINLLRYTRAQGRTFYRQAVERIEAIPGVESASLARWAPLEGGNSIRSLLVQGIEGPPEVFSREVSDPTVLAANAVNVNTVGTRWFATMGIPIAQGRDFTVQDDSGSTAVAIVNEAFVEKHLVNAPAIGQRVSLDGPKGPWREVVGVVRNFKVTSLTEVPQPLLFLPLLQSHETGMTIFVRSRSGSTAAIENQVRSEIQSLEHNLPLSSVNAMSALVSTSLYTARAGARLLLAFALMALLLAAIGLYGVVAYTVSRRTREIGLRMALGAQPNAMMFGVVRQAATLAGVGILTGLVVALGTTRMLDAFLFGVESYDGATFATIPFLLLAVAIAASVVPARRAMRIDPIRALRAE
ncbi:MAG: ADOP family duplicated permease [Gemmatimonas sp.]